MNISIFRPILTSVFLLMSSCLIAQAGSDSVESDWLELEKGYLGKTLGVELVDNDSGGEYQIITLAVPKKSVKPPREMEEVIVIGKRPKKSQPLDISYEWLDDYDNDNYGLLVTLGKKTNWPIRIYFNSYPDDLP